jgi:hypothetical protein
MLGRRMEASLALLRCRRKLPTGTRYNLVNIEVLHVLTINTPIIVAKLLFEQICKVKCAIWCEDIYHGLPCWRNLLSSFFLSIDISLFFFEKSALCTLPVDIVSSVHYLIAGKMEVAPALRTVTSHLVSRNSQRSRHPPPRLPRAHQTSTGSENSTTAATRSRTNYWNGPLQDCKGNNLWQLAVPG